MQMKLRAVCYCPHLSQEGDRSVNEALTLNADFLKNRFYKVWWTICLSVHSPAVKKPTI